MDECRCRKKGYVSRAEALTVVRKARDRGQGKLEVYLCPTSKLWHLARKRLKHRA